MIFKTLLVGLSLFSALASAQVPPVFSINSDPVCAIYEQSYLEQLNDGKLPSFNTEEIRVRENGSVYTPQQAPSVAIQFTKPIVNDQVTWLEWHPIVGLQHSFKYSGNSTDVTSIGSIKPSPNKSFVLQTNTIGWRGPFFRVWVIDDSLLNSIIANMTEKDQQVPIEESGATFISGTSEHVFYTELKNIFKFKGEFYSLTDDEVYRLKEGKFETVCRVGNQLSLQSPQITALEDIANASLMTKGVTHIPNYYGSMGSSHIKVVNGFQEAIEKPWLIQVDDNAMCFKNSHVDYCIKNKAVENTLNDLASKDPWSYREVQAIREHMKGGEYVLRQFYVNNLKINELVAEGMAKQAIYNFIEKTVYLHFYIKNRSEKTVKAIDLYTLDDENGSLTKNWFNKTELMWAAHFNDYDAVQRLLKKGNSVQDTTSSTDEYASVQYLNRSALTYAAENGTLPIIQSLIKAGADINIKDSKGNDLNYYLNKNNLVNVSIETIKLTTKVNITPSFNCKLASTKQEKAICGSKGLSIYDSQLNKLYKKVRKNIPSSEIKVLQRRWLKELKQTCSMPSTSLLTKCMKSQYRARIKYLNGLLAVKES